jgi:hypothetical protein
VCNAVVDGSMVYFNADGDNNILWCYDRDSDLWTQMPQCLNICSSFVIINHTLTAVGGIRGKFSNDVYSLKERGAWVAIFPPMPTKRASATAICTESLLIVVGGAGHGLSQCPVEVMSIEGHQWSIAAGITIQESDDFRRASGAICSDQLYILGAIDSKSVYSCTLGDLLQSCQSASTHKLAAPRESSHLNIWRKLADLPTYNSTCVSFCGHLVAIGGTDHKSLATTKTIYAYNQTTNSWEVINEMSVARRQCFAVALPATNELMVVCGTSSTFNHIDSVEFASLM